MESKGIGAAELAEVDQFLRAWEHVTLATSDAGGKPQAATIGVAVSDLREIVFDTLASTRKYSNLKANERVSLVIGWDDHKTLQVDGIADQLVPGTPDFERLQAVYLARFPSGHERTTWEGISYFRVRPTWLRYSDYSAAPRIFEMDADAL